MKDSPSQTPVGDRTAVRDLLLVAGDEVEVMERTHRLLVPHVGDTLIVSRSGGAATAVPSGTSRPEIVESLPWPPDETGTGREGGIWYAPAPGGTWAEVREREGASASGARLLAARLGGAPSMGWVVLKRGSERPPISRGELDLLREAAVAAGFALAAAGLSRRVLQARSAADAATHRWASLARMNALLVRSPDFEATVSSVLEGVVPYLADWAVVELESARGTDRRAGRHTDPQRRPLLDRLHSFPRRRPADGADAPPIPPEGLLVAEVRDEDLRRLAEPTDLDTLRALRPRSVAAVPLRAGHRMLGTLTLAAAESGQIYTADDLALFRSVAQQAGLALTSAEMYREAERARQEREEVLAMVSHDLRNPLNRVGFAVALLESPDFPDDRRADQVQLIGRAVDEMNGLIQRLLDAARIDRGRFHVEPVPESLDELVAEALHRAAPAAEQAGVRCLPPPESGAVVLADRERLLQVFANLLSNAVSFSPTGGAVEISIDLPVGEARVTIRDQGPGIDVETQRRIFDRYWQARRSGRAGAGLGLSIAQGIVHAHGGLIGVESRPGHGSSFHFTIPRVPEGPAGPAGTSTT
jgi:signal transduction histidine kinase